MSEVAPLLYLALGVLAALALVLYGAHVAITILTNACRPVRHGYRRTAARVGGNR